tara:strand:+ start:1295 stop:1711 length:417 start_codon:yes stop_codon:yes gene_type:complete
MDFNNRLNILINKYRNYNYINYHKENINIDNKLYISKYLEENLNKSNITDRIKNVTDMVYNQDWKKLHFTNRKIKIQEFIKKLIIKNPNSNLNKIELEILEKLKNKKINNKEIQYDKLNGMILDITCLNKKNNIFHLS